MDSEDNNKEENMSDIKYQSKNEPDSETKSPIIEAREESSLPSPSPNANVTDALHLNANADEESSGREAPPSSEHQEPRDSSHTTGSSSTKTIASCLSNTEKYQGDQSSCDSKECDSATMVEKSKKKVLRKMKEQQLDLSSDPGCAVAARAAPLRPLHRVSTEELACQTNPASADLLRVSLPGLLAVQRHTNLAMADHAGRLLEDGGSERSTVLSTGFSAKLRGDTPAVLVPLDKLCMQQVSGQQQWPAGGPAAPALRGGPVVDLHATYRSARTAETATSGSKRHTVDAHVTYRAPEEAGGARGRGARWTVDIDGAGLQVVVDMAAENKNKKMKPRKKNAPRKLISFWPKRTKPDLNPAVRRRLVWLEDEAEEKHVSRLQRSRQSLWSKHQPPPTEHQVTSPKTSTFRSAPELEAESTSQHLQRMSRARELKERVGRSMPTRPSEVPPPAVLPESRATGVYEDSRTKRIRDAREYYKDLSVNVAHSFNVEIDSKY